MITSDQIFSKKKRLPWRVIDDEVVIVDLSGNNVLQLNDAGRCIWEQIDGSQSVDDIVSAISNEYDVDTPTARRDTNRFLTTLADKDLIHAEKAAD